MHPANLAAAASAWSLRSALLKLHQAAADEGADIDALAGETRDGLRSARYGTIRAGGGHGDPVADTCTTLSTTPPTPWATLERATEGTLTWLADQLHLPDGRGSLDRIHQALILVPPGTAAELHRWLDEADQRIRGRLRLPSDLWPLAGNPPCPGCSVRQLFARTSAPAWVVICGAGCRCTGPDCPCGMPVRPAGAPHIWAAGSALVEQHRASVAA